MAKRTGLPAGRRRMEWETAFVSGRSWSGHLAALLAIHRNDAAVTQKVIASQQKELPRQSVLELAYLC